MSRLAKKPIVIPAGVTVTNTSGTVTVKGPKGELSFKVHPAITVETTAEGIVVTQAETTRLAQALLGTTAAHMRNMVAGVVTPFEKKLMLEGVGYRIAVAGKNLEMSLGFSHPVKVEIPEGVTVTSDKNVTTFTSPNKELVGQFAAYVRSLKKPEPYKGKGFRYDTETIRRKQGKRSV